MHLLLIYDISNDRVRTRVASACEDYGLDRTQYSSFVGNLERTHQEELMLRIQELLGHRPGRIQLIPVGADDWARRIEIEVVEDKSGDQVDETKNDEDNDK